MGRGALIGRKSDQPQRHVPLTEFADQLGHALAAGFLANLFEMRINGVEAHTPFGRIGSRCYTVCTAPGLNVLRHS